MSDTRIYEVGRSPDGVWATVYENVGNTVISYPLPHLMLHSPDGFEYGYYGSVPAELARSIVGDVFNTTDPNHRAYMAFKNEWVATLVDGGPFRISANEVKRLIDRVISIEEEQST